MRNRKGKDERTIQVQNKIFGEAYLGTVLLLFISLLVKAYVMKCDYTNYIAELIVILLSAIYIAVRSMLCGNDLMDTSKRNQRLCVLGAFGASIVITAINGVRNYTNYGEHYSGLLDGHFLAALAVTFISSFVLISIGMLFVYLCHKKGQQRIEKKLNDDIEEDQGDRL